MNTDFDDDFDDVAGAQLSGAIPAGNAPELSGSAWYDFEDEPPDHNGGQAATYQSVRPAPSHQAMHRPAPIRIRQNNWSAPDSSSFPVVTTPKALRVLSHWKKLFSLRSILILLVLLGVAGGVVFARGITSPATTGGTYVARPRLQPTPTSVVKRTVTPTPALPLAWTASGRGPADLLEVLSVAETFIQRYETIDFRSLATLSAARPLLTEAANLRFSVNDQRNSELLAQLIQQEQLVQVAFITQAQLVAAREQNGNLFAWVTVSYHLAMQQGPRETPILQQRQMTMLLIVVPFGTPRDAPPMGGIGWLVSGYSAGNTLLAIPAQP